MVTGTTKPRARKVGDQWYVWCRVYGFDFEYGDTLDAALNKWYHGRLTSMANPESRFSRIMRPQ